MNAIELAIFKVRPDVDEASLQAAIAETNRWLATPATAAAERFMSAAETQAYMAAIEAGSVSMRHFGLLP